MPADYEKKLAEIRAAHPDMSDEEAKSQAARITNWVRKRQGRPAARFHRKGRPTTRPT